MNGFDSPNQESIKRRWQDVNRVSTLHSTRLVSTAVPPSSSPFMPNGVMRSSAPGRVFPGFDDEDLVSAVVPAVTVVLEGRSICQRISLHQHASYQSLAKALRQMFVDGADHATSDVTEEDDDLNLLNAVPGHLVAYEDMENDLLLAGDLNWKDFVRVAKRIRILPVKGKTRKGREEWA
ncbi:auxin-responsive protein IAA33 [Carica papaya]|uniref:auxin-responsive protein IAA33 n=1 Tax=Carica papaya TaxID=3649 RepID=UPI000B8C7A4D|nr:auxin-responsive protein IAA33 [Carica papaya]